MFLLNKINAKKESKKEIKKILNEYNIKSIYQIKELDQIALMETIIKLSYEYPLPYSILLKSCSIQNGYTENMDSLKNILIKWFNEIEKIIGEVILNKNERLSEYKTLFEYGARNIRQNF